MLKAFICAIIVRKKGRIIKSESVQILLVTTMPCGELNQVVANFTANPSPKLFHSTGISVWIQRTFRE